MRIARIGMLGALVIGAISCTKDDGPTTANIPPLAFVRYINAVPDTFNTVLRWMDQVPFSPQTFVNVPYRGMGQGGYQGLEAGSRHLRVFTIDPNINNPNANTQGATTAQLADTTFDFVAGQHYTLLHYGYARAGQLPQQKVHIIADPLPAVDAANVSFNAMNATLGIATDNVDFLIGAVAVGTGVARATSTAFTTRAPAAFTLGVAEAGAPATIATAAAPAGVLGDTLPNGQPNLAGDLDPIAGATIGGSVLTAVAFGPSVAGSPAAASANPTVIWFQSRQPPRFGQQ